MLIYKTRLRIGTVLLRLFMSLLALLLFLTGALGLIGLLLGQNYDTGALIFVIVTMSLPVLIFRISGWNIRQYYIYDDRLDVRVLWGIKTFSYPAASLTAFNQLTSLLQERSTGIGIVTTDKKIIKVLELEVAEFPVFIDHLQKIVRWDLELTVRT